jgi:ABC-type glycerol-3-phosphate transport system substrate-binding protein
VFIYQHGGRVLDDWGDPTRTTFDDPLTIEALEWYDNLVHVHKMMPTPDQVYLAPFEGSMEGGVYRGKVAMWTSAESRAYEQLVGDDVAAVARASVDGALMFSPRLFQAGGWFFPFNSAVEAVTEGRATAEEALTRAQQQTE